MCGVSRRQMTDSLVLARDFFLYLPRKVDPTFCILGSELEKAFDSVSHTYFKSVLAHLELGEIFQKWVNLLYTNCKSVVMVNGRFIPTVNIKSGVRQGCSLSPILFILAIELLACSFKQNKNIRGLCISEIKEKNPVIQVII